MLKIGLIFDESRTLVGQANASTAVITLFEVNKAAMEGMMTDPEFQRMTADYVEEHIVYSLTPLWAQTSGLQLAPRKPWLKNFWTWGEKNVRGFHIETWIDQFYQHLTIMFNLMNIWPLFPRIRSFSGLLSNPPWYLEAEKCLGAGLGSSNN